MPYKTSNPSVSNIGNGVGIYSGFSGSTLNFKTLSGSSGIQLTSNSSKIIISSTSSRLLAYTTTVTTGSTTTLTSGSTYLQYFTGTLNQTVTLPVVSTIPIGYQYKIVNKSTGIITIRTSGNNTLLTLGSGISTIITSISNSGTGTSSWSIEETNASNIATGEKIVTVTTDGVQTNYDFQNYIISAAALEALAESAWTTGIATSPGLQGQVAYGTSYKYECIGTNSWIRTLILEQRIELYLTPDFNDSINEGTTVSLDAAYPNAVIGQRVWGTTKNVYEKKNTNLWKKMPIAYTDMEFLPNYRLLTGITSGSSINILGTYDIVSIVAEATTTNSGNIKIGSTLGDNDVVDVTSLPNTIGTKKQLNYLVNSNYPNGSARNIYVHIDNSSVILKLHIVEQKMFK